MTKSIGLLSAMLTVLIPAMTLAQSGDKVQATSVADVSAIQPGKPFWVGFKFTVEAGWHIYWKNPGDSGLATQVKLKLPEGFTAGELQFPIPQKLVLPGGDVDYIYENEVILLLQITPPKDLGVGSPVKIGAKASWLVCKEDCLPGGGDVSLELPVAETDTPANEDLFKAWTGKLPVKKDDADIASTSTTSAITDGDGNATIKIVWKKEPSDIQFIPGTMKTGDASDLKCVTADATSTISFNIKHKKDFEPLTGLVTFTKSDGTKTALEISIPGSGGVTVPPKPD